MTASDPQTFNAPSCLKFLTRDTQRGGERGSGATGALAIATAPAQAARGPAVRVGAEELDSTAGRRLRGVRVGVTHSTIARVESGKCPASRI